MKELKQLERQTRTAVERVRSKKVMIDIVVIETHNIRKKNIKNVINFTTIFFFKKTNVIINVTNIILIM